MNYMHIYSKEFTVKYVHVLYFKQTGINNLLQVLYN